MSTPGSCAFCRNADCCDWEADWGVAEFEAGMAAFWAGCWYVGWGGTAPFEGKGNGKFCDILPGDAIHMRSRLDRGSSQSESKVCQLAVM